MSRIHLRSDTLILCLSLSAAAAAGALGVGCSSSSDASGAEAAAAGKSSAGGAPGKAGASNSDAGAPEDTENGGETSEGGAADMPTGGMGGKSGGGKGGASSGSGGKAGASSSAGGGTAGSGEDPGTARINHAKELIAGLDEGKRCTDCHQSNYAGLGFWPNITPDEDNGIGLWTGEQIAEAFTKGIKNDGSTLCGTMERYHFNQEDTDDIVLMLQSLPANSKKITQKCMTP